MTGVDGPSELLRARAEERPSHLGIDLRALAQTHPAPERGEDGRWTCRDAVAQVQAETVLLHRPDGQLDLHAGAEITLDELRAACAACWAASDEADRKSVV